MQSTADTAKELRVHPCTLTRWRALGLPATAYERRPGGFVYDVELVRLWLTDPTCPAHVTAQRILQ
jgi:hypothetical protein